MNFIGLKRVPPSLLAALPAAALLLASFGNPARAEVVTLLCGQFTYDIDLENHTVFYAGGAISQPTVPANITDRYIEWSNPYNQIGERIDRLTGLYTVAINGQWSTQSTACQRVTGKPVI